MSATFSVTENDDYLTNFMTASYQIGGKARNYYAEIYKVVSPSGGVNGVIGTNKRVTRTMAVSSYELTKDFFEDNWKYKMLSESAKTVGDSGYDAYTSYVVSPADVTLGSALIDKYCDIVCNKYISYFRFEVRELDDAYQWVRISRNGTRIAEYTFEVKPGAEASDWGRSMLLPNGGTGKQETDIIFDGSGCSVYEVSPVSGNLIYSDSAYDDIKIEFDASGKKGSDEWQYRNLKFYTKKLDRAEPAKQYVAPIALTDYKAGDEVMLTVIYNEAINKISGTPSLSLSSKLSPYFESPTYVNNGTGTNAIVFKVKVKADFNANTAQLINEYLAFPESSYKSNGFSGNIGSVSAAVWDILGN